MTTDIHLYVEYWEEGKWVSADIWKYVTYDRWWKRSSYYSNQNYRLFAFLAGVRNRDYQPLSYPRGLPIDVSPEVRGNADFFEGDAHTHSWFLLSELLAVDWTSPEGTRDSEIRWFTPTTFLKALEKMEKLGDPDEVRVVFWFDN